MLDNDLSVATTGFDMPRRSVGGAALVMRGASRKISKPAQRKPVIIYMVSPEIIHVEADEFMPLVQQLTGPDKPAGPSPGSGASPEPAVSPRAGRMTAKVRVMARAVNLQWPAPPSEFQIHGISPRLQGAAIKGLGSVVCPPSWMQHGGDHFLGPAGGTAAAGNVDIYGSLPSQQ